MSTSSSGSTDIDRVRDATDLVRLVSEHVPLRPRGREHVGLCPFHDDRRPSLAVVTHKGDGFYNCFACGASGDCFRFVMDYHKMDFGEALRYLADRAGIELRPRQSADRDATGGDAPKRSDLRKAVVFAADFFRAALDDPERGAEARNVIEQRGIRDDMVEQFMLGAAPRGGDALVRRIGGRPASLRTAAAAGLVKRRGGEHPDDVGVMNAPDCYDAFRHRLVFPIFDDLGRPIAFGGRSIDPDDQPKYLNSAENALFHKSRTLYGLHLAKRAIIESGQAIVVEGYTDVIACHQASVTNVVGTLGTALTTEHAAVLARLCDSVVLVFDGDEAGRKAADRGVEVFFREPVDIRICVLPNGLDPDDLLRESDGVDCFHAAVDRATDALEYKLDRFQSGLDAAAGISARQKRLEAFLRDLGELGYWSLKPLRKQPVVDRLQSLTGLSPSVIEDAIPRPSRRAAGATPVGAASREPATIDDLLATESKLVTVSRARRIAEQDLLAILLFESAVGLEPIIARPGDDHADQADDDDAATGRPIADVLGIGDFLDPRCRRLAELVLPWLERGHAFSMQQVLTGLDDEDARLVAGDLFREGRRRCESEGATARRELRLAAGGLSRVIERERYEQQVAARRSVRAIEGGPTTEAVGPGPDTPAAPAPGADSEPRTEMDSDGGGEIGREGENSGVGASNNDVGPDGGTDGDAVLEQIKRRRMQGVLPAAISQRVRS